MAGGKGLYSLIFCTEQNFFALCMNFLIFSYSKTKFNPFTSSGICKYASLLKYSSKCSVDRS